MAKFDPSRPRPAVTFQCRHCRKTFEAAPGRTEDAAELAPHPFRYFAECPGCYAEVGQAPWDRALQSAWTSATGPRTPEGKAASSANGKGHPTPEEAQRTRFNAMKTGLHAKTARYFPAKPDGYPFCKTCDVERDWCAAQPACVKQTEIFMLHHAAFDQKDPTKLQPLYADMQAAIFAVLQQIIQTIIVDGVKIETPEYYTDEDGAVVIAQYYDMNDGGKQKTLMNLEAHPLFRPLGELLSRANLSLSDMGMTVKVIDHQEEEMGHLAAIGSDKETIDDYRRRQEAALGRLADLVDRGRTKRERDPVLLEYNKDTGEAAPVGK